MHITWNDLAWSVEGLDTEMLLSEWRWLVPPTLRPVMLSSLGDLFFQDSAGAIHWLSTGWGTLERVAESPQDFDAKRSQHEWANQWFAPTLIAHLLASGMRLEPGECFGYKVPPALGGQPDPGNFEPTSLPVHFGILGQIHRQIKDLPPGTPIGKIKIEGLG